MKLKLVEAGYEKFTGHFGHVYFEDGVSVDDVSQADARLFASITTVEVVGEGTIAGDNERYQGSMDIPAVTVTYPTLADLQRAEAAAVHTLMSPAEGQEPVAEVTAKVWTVEELEEVADKKGIAGLREIADPMGVRARGINELIGEIIAKQTPPAPAAAPLPEGQPDVVTTEKA